MQRTASAAPSQYVRHIDVKVRGSFMNFRKGKQATFSRRFIITGCQIMKGGERDANVRKKQTGQDKKWVELIQMTKSSISSYLSTYRDRALEEKLEMNKTTFLSCKDQRSCTNTHNCPLRNVEKYGSDFTGRA